MNSSSAIHNNHVEGLRMRSVLITYWGTVLYTDAFGTMRHGPLGEHPVNVSLDEQGQLAMTGPAAAAELIHVKPGGPGNGVYAIRQQGGFLSAEFDGSIVLKAEHADLLELLLSIPLELYINLVALLEWDWSCDGRILRRGEISMQPWFGLNVQGRSLSLTNQRMDLEMVFHGERPVSACLRSDGVEYRLRRYEPLIYFCAFGPDPIFAMLALALESIAKAEPAADYPFLVISDRNRRELSLLISPALMRRVRVINRSCSGHADMFSARYDLDGLGVENFQPLLYLDVDMICISPLSRLLASINQDDAFYTAVEFDGKTLDQIEHHIQRWFGLGLFVNSGVPLGEVKCINSGAIAYSNLHFAAPHLAAIRERIQQDFVRNEGELQIFGDQPIANFLLQRRRTVVADYLNAYLAFDGRSAPSEATCLIHFNKGVGNSEKLPMMRSCFDSLYCRQADADTTSTAEHSIIKQYKVSDQQIGSRA